VVARHAEEHLAPRQRVARQFGREAGVTPCAPMAPVTASSRSFGVEPAASEVFTTAKL
jgi:hypothetical protein